MKIAAAVVALAFVVIAFVLTLFHQARTGVSHFADEVKRSPFGGNPAAYSSMPYRPPAEFQLDLHDVRVRSTEDISEEKQVLALIRKELEAGSQAPVFKVKWRRIVPRRVAEECTFTYFRSAMQVEYQSSLKPKIACDKVTVAEFYKIEIAPNSTIAEQIALRANNR